MHPRRWRKSWILLNLLGFIIFLGFCLQVLTYQSSNRNNKKSDNSEKSKKIDWNDYKIIAHDLVRTGFGELGRGEKLTDPVEIQRNEELFKEFGMSVLVSDKISVNRSIPDFRHPDCLKKKYLHQLPRVSIVIIFNNEIFSVFKRTLHSLYNRTPHELIEEVILVNDNSTLDYLYNPLESYIKENFQNIEIRIINLQQRSGLMKARIAGLKAARSEFVFVSEPHCEMTYNWLPPLIEPLLKDHRTVTVPIIDNVEHTGMEYYENDLGNLGSRGVFDWYLEYQKLKRFPINDDEKLEPFSTPIMTGGVFMIRKKYFFEIGGYDEELLIWGAENIEMSLKIHLCGGQLLEVPCSRIGHVFRAFTKSRQHESGIDFVSFNRKRIVDVWFDKYKKYVYRKIPQLPKINAGNLTKPNKLKENLKCKPFQYFLDVVAPDLNENFSYRLKSFSRGNVELSGESFCLQLPKDLEGSLVIAKCLAEPKQEFEFTKFSEIKNRDSSCFDFFNSSMKKCHQSGGNQFFEFLEKTSQIYSHSNDQCLEADIETMTTRFMRCDKDWSLQKWTWKDFR